MPFLVILTFDIVIPLFYAVYTSAYGGTGLSFEKYVGFQNYAAVFADSRFWASVSNMLYFSAISVPVIVALTVGLALFIDSKIWKQKTILKLIVFLPYAVPTVISGLVWSFMFDNRIGPVPLVLGIFGINMDMLSAANVYYAMLMMVTWAWSGFFLIILLAGLRTVPNSIYEAAQIDGASAFSMIVDIKLPSIGGFIILVLAMSLINNLLLFNEPYILGYIVGLPDNITPNIYIYTMTYKWGLYGLGAAMAFIMVLVSFALSFLFMYFTVLRRR